MKIVIMKNINLSQSTKVCGILYNKIYAITQELKTGTKSVKTR